MKLPKISMHLWMGTVASLALVSNATAENIDTTPFWNGSSFISTWGTPNTATYGQTITPTATQTRLSGFTFYLSQSGGTAPQYQAFVYQWDAANQRITGPAIYTSGVLMAPSGSAYTPVIINTGGVALSAGQQYVLFLTTSTVGGQPSGSYRYGALTNNTAYAGGQFVFFNNGSNFAQLSSSGWSSIAEDLAFQAFLAGGTTGENHAQAQTGVFQLGGAYLNLLTDPFALDKVTTPGTMGYAGEKQIPATARSAFAAYMKAPPAVIQAPRWEIWEAAFGGANNMRGDSGAGTSGVNTRVVGLAAGADYRFSADTLVGFSLAGGYTNWSLSPATDAAPGRGWSDSIMAGIYGRQNFGAAYIALAASYANYWMETSRSSAPGANDDYRASFTAQSWGGRVEAGYKLGHYWLANWTPYGALQGQAFRTPDYAETGGAATGLALSVAGRTATAYRGEVGLRADRIVAMDAGGVTNLFGKLAYAHDEISAPEATISFIGLAGAGGAPFTVFGSRPSRDLALVTGGAEWRLLNGWSFLAKFDGEFGDRSEAYAGTGRVRYTW